MSLKTKISTLASHIKRLVCDGLVRLFRRKRADKEIVSQYMATHPEAWDGVERATYAYHKNHREAGAHYFLTAMREAKCQWCGRSREEVRHGDEKPACAARPKWADETIESVIAREEKLFGKVMDRAKKLAATIDVPALTGEELARMHHTYGVDPSMLEAALMLEGRSLPQSLHDDYQRAYAEHRETGKRGLVREVIVAKTANDLSNAAYQPAGGEASTETKSNERKT